MTPPCTCVQWGLVNKSPRAGSRLAHCLARLPGLLAHTPAHMAPGGYRVRKAILQVKCHIGQATVAIRYHLGLLLWCQVMMPVRWSGWLARLAWQLDPQMSQAECLCQGSGIAWLHELVKEVNAFFIWLKYRAIFPDGIRYRLGHAISHGRGCRSGVDGQGPYRRLKRLFTGQPLFQ